ncbi:MAG: hypothetical protein L0206_04015, partial [Actinobacteria bacterium]|nr:hypothetical protein [Actinomycetota bacterium]
VDGDRVALVRECPPLDCSGPHERTLFTYEATGEISTVYDAKAVAASNWSDPTHYLRRHYDTLGRVWKTEDPDGGTSTTAYDAFGNVAETQNARGQVVGFTYDALDRLRTIDQPAGPQHDYEIVYAANQRQAAQEWGREQNATVDYSRLYDYDDMGRLEQKRLDLPGKSLLLDFAYDELGRTTAIRYPDNETLIRYEYTGAYLKRVCEVSSPAALDCNAAGAIFYVSAIGYDSLGRRATVTTPAGTRTYSYLPTTQRLAKDHFASSTSGLYSRTLRYATESPAGSFAEPGYYDALGNILQIAGTSTGAPVDFSASYTYDERNRLKTWTPGTAAAKHFNYDELGNLTGHAVGSATAVNQAFSPTQPHAVTARTDLGRTYGYDADGNLSSETWSGGARYYSFDALNRL